MVETKLFDLTGKVALLTGASKAGAYITGQAITICGGTNMWN